MAFQKLKKEHIGLKLQAEHRHSHKRAQREILNVHWKLQAKYLTD